MANGIRILRRIMRLHRIRLQRRYISAVTRVEPARLVAYATHRHIEVIVLGLMLLTVVLCVAVDSRRSGRIRGASLIPGLFIALVNVATCIAQLAT